MVSALLLAMMKNDGTDDDGDDDDADDDDVDDDHDGDLNENRNYYIVIRYILGYIGIIGVYIGVILG